MIIYVSLISFIYSFSRGINDLDDVRIIMEALLEIRENQIRIDMTIGPVEETYALLNKLELTYNDGYAEKVDSLAYSWKSLLDMVIELLTSYFNP